jgi:hypothetical protein
MSENQNPIAHELRVAARGRSDRTPLIVLVGVACIVFSAASIISAITLLAYWLG